jgi:hypothetical protein
MTADDRTGMMNGWTASEASQLRELLGLKPEGFARRLKIHQRTVLRWRDGETDPAPGLWKDLDNLLIETARKLAPWLHLDQLSKMHRRELLTILAASMDIPLAGVDLLWNGILTEVSSTSLSNLEEITSALANRTHATHPHILLAPVLGHLEKATALMSGTMRPSQRRRLESIVADAAIFAGVLSRASGKLAQAHAHLGFAEDMANQSNNMALLAQVYAQQGLLDYYSQTPNGEQRNLQDRIQRFERANELAARYAPAVVQMATSAWLAGPKAAANDGYGADQALERSQSAFERAKLEGPAGSGYCSSNGYYQGWNEGDLAGFQGSVELRLKRPSVVSTIETSVQLTTNPRARANTLAHLARALNGQKQPEEACACLTEAHLTSLDQGSATILHHVITTRVLMPAKWNRLRCVQELDERLGWRICGA